MSRHPIEVRVSPEDHKELQHLLHAGIQQVRVVLRAIALEQLSLGRTALDVARMVHLSPQAVRRIAQRYQARGLERALYERQGRGAKELLDASQKQRIIAMVCSQPPEGQARWTALCPKTGSASDRCRLQSPSQRSWPLFWPYASDLRPVSTAADFCRRMVGSTATRRDRLPSGGEPGAPRATRRKTTPPERRSAPTLGSQGQDAWPSHPS